MADAYPILTTDAFIIYTRGVGEADRIITALTKSNGLMQLYARSIRKEGAKMRGAAKPYARVSLSAILSKRNILKDIVIIDTLDALWQDTTKYTAFVTLLHSIRAFIPITESCDDEVFAIAEITAQLLQQSELADTAHVLLVAQVMLLTNLGYVSDRNIIPGNFVDVLTETIANPRYHKTLQQHLANALHYQ